FTMRFHRNERTVRQSKAKIPCEARLAASSEARGSNSVRLEKLAKLLWCASAAFKIDPPETEATQRPCVWDSVSIRPSATPSENRAARSPPPERAKPRAAVPVVVSGAADAFWSRPDSGAVC